jgi:hypothetical protein
MARKTFLEMLWVKVFVIHMHDRNIETLKSFILMENIVCFFESCLLYDWLMLESCRRLVEIQFLPVERVFIMILFWPVHYLATLIKVVKVIGLLFVKV